MKQIRLLALDTPDAYLDELLPLHEALLLVAERTNNLRQFVISSLMTKQIAQAKDMLRRSRGDKRYYCYLDDPFIYFVEDTDTITEIMGVRDRYVYNVACAA